MSLNKLHKGTEYVNTTEKHDSNHVCGASFVEMGTLELHLNHQDKFGPLSIHPICLILFASSTFLTAYYLSLFSYTLLDFIVVRLKRPKR